MNSGALRYCSGDLSVLGTLAAKTLAAEDITLVGTLTTDTLDVTGPCSLDTLTVTGGSILGGLTSITGGVSVTGVGTFSTGVTATAGPIMSNGHLVPGSLAPPANSTLVPTPLAAVASGAQGKFAFSAANPGANPVVPAPAAGDIYHMLPPAGYKVDARTTLQISNAGATCQGVWSTMSAAGASPDQGYAAIALQSAVAVPLPSPAIYSYAWFGLQPI